LAVPASAATIIGASVSPASAAAGPDLGSQLSAGQTMQAGQYLQSPGGQYKLVMQTDGNLVEYNAADVALWDPPPPNGLYGHTGDRAVLQQSDGNFVVLSSGSSPLWSSGTYGNPGDHLSLQDDGNLVIYSATGSALWATMTGTVPPRGQTVASEPGYPWGQCTRYAEEMAHAYTGLWLPVLGNAKDWWANARNDGWSVGLGPQIGSIIVFAPGTDGAGPYGHVAWVTNFHPNTGVVDFYEMNYNGLGQIDPRYITNGINNPNIHYIYLNP
jgi:surface antigen